MQFPVFQTPFLGNGLTIALDAVIHVLLSHGFAIGAFSLLLWIEFWGWRKNLPAWDAFAQRYLRFLVVVITAVGAVTGVGIWFFISALEPRGTASLLRIFFWAWFTEWVVFTGEVILLLLYFFTWNRWIGKRKAAHLWLGVGHTIFGILSAVLITGVLGFMLTSDSWPWGGTFWQAFFNASFLPQLILRVAAAFALGALITLAFILLTSTETNLRRELLPLTGKVLLTSLPVVALASIWYFRIVPEPFLAHASFAVLTSNLSQQPQLLWQINGVLIALLVLLGALALLRQPALARLLVLPAILAAVILVGEFERTREFIRGPYVMPGYMYANQVLLSEQSLYDEQGLLPNSYWYNATVQNPDVVTQGAYVFGQNCSVCHSIGGMNNIAQKVRGRSQDGILAILNHTHEMVPFMAPLAASPQEREALATFLFQLSSGTLPEKPSSRFMDYH